MGVPPISKPTRIMVVDDDAWIRKMVMSVLERRGYQVVAASNGEEALKLVDTGPPDLVITDVQMPRMDGWSLIRVLRTRPETAFTPVIFLTALGSEEDRIRGFRLGADDYLPKPFRFEELDLRVGNALRHSGRLREEARHSTSPSNALQGALDQIGLSALLVMLETERKSGILVIQNKKDVYRLFLRNGNIVQASPDGQAHPRGAACIYEALTWSEGRFDFSVTEVEMEDQIACSTTHLLLEGARLIDESRPPARPEVPE